MRRLLIVFACLLAWPLTAAAQTKPPLFAAPVIWPVVGYDRIARVHAGVEVWVPFHASAWDIIGSGAYGRGGIKATVGIGADHGGGRASWDARFVVYRSTVGVEGGVGLFAPFHLRLGAGAAAGGLTWSATVSWPFVLK